MIDDDELIMISALQHYLFCPRQCALIHVDRMWGENYLTASGRRLHARVDRPVAETRRDVHRAMALKLISAKLGMMGVADLVEFYREDGETRDGRRVAVRLPNQPGWWRPFPVEYKRGRPKANRADEVQLCAQALCLEEMKDVVIEKGALFYGETKRRVEVSFNVELRRLTAETIVNVRRLLAEGKLPPPILTSACGACSLVEECRPDVSGADGVVEAWLRRKMEGA